MDENGNLIQNKALNWRTMATGSATHVMAAFDPSIVGKILVDKINKQFAYRRRHRPEWLVPCGLSYWHERRGTIRKRQSWRDEALGTKRNVGRSEVRFQSITFESTVCTAISSLMSKDRETAQRFSSALYTTYDCLLGLTPVTKRCCLWKYMFTIVSDEKPDKAVTQRFNST